ncbi:glycosyl hydrolase family 95 catalytic domain-containing protein [Pontiella agarivorans]|uniref:Glycoside hydrolase N-terminal domain-containing protein n=1 Tax=Pontiella agarivorans TaxID=3038953 RepID=A0ABU5MUD8_9BACT|nr:glycoside hydrolase N-terminal domain-containing protein [Pontiella agarivorans]MDZ8117833.1 glycoside hydrolase N-terminal domain-containing protein [Pontiella agarivorans]
MSRNSFIAVGLTLLAVVNRVDAADSGRWTLWSEKPAQKWEDAFVTGNGRHGTMIWGKAGKETITCVHEELFIPAWERDKRAVADIADDLPEVRRLIRAGDPAGAAKLAVAEARKQLEPQGITNDGWPVVPHPAFDLEVIHEGDGKVVQFRRALNLENGEALSRWSDGINEVEQRVFSSQADNINVVELRSTKGRKLNLTLRLAERPGRIDSSETLYRNIDINGAFNSITSGVEPGWLFYHADYALDRRGYDGVGRVSLTGGSMSRDGDLLRIKDVERVLVLIRIELLEQGGTSSRKRIQKTLEKLPLEYEALLKPHALKHGDMFRRVTLDMGCARKWREESNEQLLADIRKNGVSAHFLEKVHAMGRYLLISTTGKYPAPLQGIWGAAWRAAWGGSFTTNSNVNLAISSFGMGNLPECAEAYYEYIQRQLPGWRANAKYHVGCRGILASLNMDPETGYETHFHAVHPALYWVGGTGWNIRPLYDYALLSGDDVFMKEKVLPLYQELGLFYEDYLLRGEDGVYDIIPSQSPENDPGGKRGERLTENATFSVAVAKECFDVLLELGEQFRLPADDIARWKEIREHLPAYRVNEDGALAEWIPAQYKDHYKHRHNSHLYPVYPGMELVPPGVDPVLEQAARVALEKRFAYDTTSAHGLMHAALMASRLRDAEKVQVNLDRFARRRYLYSGFVTSHNPNHKVYNLDAALSMPRLLMEMVVLSKPGFVELLPGWPESYADGSLNGVLIRGGHKMDISWADGKLKSAVLYAGKDGSCEIRYKELSRSLDLKAGKTYRLNAALLKEVEK